MEFLAAFLVVLAAGAALALCSRENRPEGSGCGKDCAGCGADGCGEEPSWDRPKRPEKGPPS